MRLPLGSVLCPAGAHPPPRDPGAPLRYDPPSAHPAQVEPPHVNQPLTNSLRSGPDNRGRFGEFGGWFVAETLMPVILEVEQAYEAAKKGPEFTSELKSLPNGLP